MSTESNIQYFIMVPIDSGTRFEKLTFSNKSLDEIDGILFSNKSLHEIDGILRGRYKEFEIAHLLPVEHDDSMVLPSIVQIPAEYLQHSLSIYAQLPDQNKLVISINISNGVATLSKNLYKLKITTENPATKETTASEEIFYDYESCQERQNMLESNAVAGNKVTYLIKRQNFKQKRDDSISLDQQVMNFCKDNALPKIKKVKFAGYLEVIIPSGSNTEVTPFKDAKFTTEVVRVKPISLHKDQLEHLYDSISKVEADYSASEAAGTAKPVRILPQKETLKYLIDQLDILSNSLSYVTGCLLKIYQSKDDIEIDKIINDLEKQKNDIEEKYLKTTNSGFDNIRNKAQALIKSQPHDLSKAQLEMEGIYTVLSKIARYSKLYSFYNERLVRFKKLKDEKCRLEEEKNKLVEAIEKDIARVFDESRDKAKDTIKDNLDNLAMLQNDDLFSMKVLNEFFASLPARHAQIKVISDAIKAIQSKYTEYLQGSFNSIKESMTNYNNKVSHILSKFFGGPVELVKDGKDFYEYFASMITLGHELPGLSIDVDDNGRLGLCRYDPES